ncbi:unnamed protein product [Ectocarpus sp. 12 AP-2014]
MPGLLIGLPAALFLIFRQAERRRSGNQDGTEYRVFVVLRVVEEGSRREGENNGSVFDRWVSVTHLDACEIAPGCCCCVDSSGGNDEEMCEFVGARGAVQRGTDRRTGGQRTSESDSAEGSGAIERASCASVVCQPISPKLVSCGSAPCQPNPSPCVRRPFAHVYLASLGQIRW